MIILLANSHNIVIIALSKRNELNKKGNNMKQHELNLILKTHKKYLNGEGEEFKADLRGANLRYADLRGANLEGANLEGANLHAMQTLKVQTLAMQILAVQTFAMQSFAVQILAMQILRCRP